MSESTKVNDENNGASNGQKNSKDKKTDDKNIIHFPAHEKRQSQKKKKSAEKEQERKEREALEKQYRAEYRAKQAKQQSQMAQRSAAGKKPFINWHKIPPFTRYAVGTFIIIQIILSFLLPESDKFAITYHFGFVPAIYTGAAEWSWAALIAPFTTLILHGGWMHLLFNIVMMLAMGVFFERQFGAKRTFIVFLLCGLAGNLTYLLLSPASQIPVIGASGAISGLFAIAITAMIESGIAGPEAQKRGAFPFILLWIAIIIGIGMISHDTAWQSHLGGFFGGLALHHLWKKGIIKF